MADHAFTTSAGWLCSFSGESPGQDNGHSRTGLACAPSLRPSVRPHTSTVLLFYAPILFPFTLKKISQRKKINEQRETTADGTVAAPPPRRRSSRELAVQVNRTVSRSPWVRLGFHHLRPQAREPGSTDDDAAARRGQLIALRSRAPLEKIRQRFDFEPRSPPLVSAPPWPAAQHAGQAASTDCVRKPYFTSLTRTRSGHRVQQP